MLFNTVSNSELTVTPTDVAETVEAVESAVSESDILSVFTNADPGRFIEMLPKLGIGMISIFIVIGVIILATSLLNKIFSKKKKKAE